MGTTTMEVITVETSTIETAANQNVEAPILYCTDALNSSKSFG